MKKFEWLKVYNSPWVTPKLTLKAGKIQWGTPYFLPRRFISNPNKTGWTCAVPVWWFKFDVVRLGWKTKWEDTDYRFEHGPLISLVIFGLQIVLTVKVPEMDHYWESWLYYHRNTDKSLSKDERLQQTKKRVSTTMVKRFWR